MKKKLTKKLMLNKNTISNLNDNEMKLVKGATLIDYCTASCSLLDICCPTTQENIIPQNLYQGQG